MFRPTLLLSTGRVLARTPAATVAVAVARPTKLFAQSLRALTTTITPAADASPVTGLNLFIKDRTAVESKGKRSKSSSQFQSRRSKPWSESLKQFNSEWESLSESEKASYIERAAAGEGLKWPELYPHEEKMNGFGVFLSSRRKFLASQLGEVASFTAKTEEGSKAVVQAEWVLMSEEEQAKFPPQTRTVQAPKLKHERFPREVKFESFDVYCKAFPDKTPTNLGREWKALSEEEKAKYPAIAYTMEKAEKGADFEHFFRIHRRDFIKYNFVNYAIGGEEDVTNLPNNTDTKNTDFGDAARVLLQKFWNEKLTDEQKDAYAC